MELAGCINCHSGGESLGCYLAPKIDDPVSSQIYTNWENKKCKQWNKFINKISTFVPNKEGK